MVHMDAAPNGITIHILTEKTETHSGFVNLSRVTEFFRALVKAENNTQEARGASLNVVGPWTTEHHGR